MTTVVREIEKLLLALEKAAARSLKQGKYAAASALSSRAQQIRSVSCISRPEEVKSISRVDEVGTEIADDQANRISWEPCPSAQLLGFKGWVPDTLGEENSWGKAYSYSHTFQSGKPVAVIMNRFDGDWEVNGSTLVLGKTRSKNRVITGGGLAQGTGRFTFVRDKEWHSGSYDVKVTVKPLTTTIQMGVILGYTRGYRAFGCDIGMGGRTVRINYGDYRRRDSRLLGQLNKHFARVQDAKKPIELEFRVRANKISIYLDGTLIGVHHAGDSLPIEGYIGFVVKYGSVSLRNPTVKRHYVGSDGSLCGFAEGIEELDPGKEFAAPWTSVIGRTSPLPNVPGEGQLVIVLDSIPAKHDGDAADRVDLLRRVTRTALRSAKSALGNQGRKPFEDELERVVWVPAEDYSDSDWQDMTSQLSISRLFPGVGHSCLENAEKGITNKSFSSSWANRGYHLLFIDADGVIRAADHAGSIRRWYQVLRGF